MAASNDASVCSYETPLWKAVAHFAQKIGDHANDLTLEAAEGKACFPKAYPEHACVDSAKGIGRDADSRTALFIDSETFT